MSSGERPRERVVKGTTEKNLIALSVSGNTLTITFGGGKV